MYLALLRGINVGGKNKLSMKALAEMFSAVGCSEVRTYIQSGNVVFNAPSELVGSLAERITAQIAEQYSYKIPIVLRTTEELRQAIASNPFLTEGAALDSLHILFLGGTPEAKQIAALNPARSLPDRFVVVGQEVYLQLPNGAGRTKLTNDYFEGVLKTVSTARNWRTVTTLLDWMEGK